MAPLLEVRALEKVYDNGVHALRDVSFAVDPGEFVAVIGLSGSGKSTLLRCINRLIEPTSGEVLLHGVDLRKLAPRDLRRQRRRIGMIFQHFNLIERKSVLANVLAGRLADTSTAASLLGLFAEDDRSRALEYLRVVGLGDKAATRASELSGGQKQRVAIARALMQEPELLLADEPVASLDPATSHSVMRHLETANRELGKTILCNLHFLSLVRQYATRAIALKEGRIVFEGRADEIDEERFRAIYGEEAVEVEVR